MKTSALSNSIAAGLLLCLPSPGRAAEPVDFNRDIRPILAENCFKCHGLDETARKAKLRLDEREVAVLPAKSGDIAIVPGKPAESELLNRVASTEEDEKMPPADTGKSLKPEQIELLRRWIAEGAPYARHWAFERPVKAPLPSVKDVKWPRQPIDKFVLARLEAEGLTPSPVAEKTTLLRRVALDLTGLPPSDAVREAFLKDASPEAYEQLVDQLLASPAYGERWARPWLDLARYADTKGYEKDLSRSIWRYRDWVIDAFNADLPYDEFTREQLAGDLLPNPTASQLVATAFHRNTMTNEEGGVDGEEYRIINVKDRVDTTVQVWMGLTMGCAKCHSHKFDPISQREYYRFYAFFNQTEDANRSDESPTAETPTPAEQKQIDRLEAAIADAERKLAAPSSESAVEMRAWEEELRRAAPWHMAHPTSMQAASGAQLEAQSDGSVLVKGTAPATETYTLKFPAGLKRVTGLRLEALPDAANPKRASGRATQDGNFVLTAIHLTALSADGNKTDIPLTKAAADFSQKDYPVEHALRNPDPKHHGWAVGPRMAEPHQAVFSTEMPVELTEGAELTLTLDHQFEYTFPGFSIGKFRISVTDDEGPRLSPFIPEEAIEIARISPEQRSAEQSDRLREILCAIRAASPAASCRG